jgi:hypothetical protein
MQYYIGRRKKYAIKFLSNILIRHTYKKYKKYITHEIVNDTAIAIVPINNYNYNHIDNNLIEKLNNIKKNLNLEASTICIIIDSYRRYLNNNDNNILAFCVYIVLACKFNEDILLNKLFNEIYKYFQIDKNKILENEYYYYDKIDFILSIK